MPPPRHRFTRAFLSPPSHPSRLRARPTHRHCAAQGTASGRAPRNTGLARAAVATPAASNAARIRLPRAGFEQLARFGYRQVEFAGYGQPPNAPGGASPESVAGARLLRGWLDDNGLHAQGNHGYIPGSWLLTGSDLDTFKKHLEIANILGLPHMGTGADPTSSPYQADWDVAADKWHALGDLARRAGIKLYTHNHDAAYDFLLDGGPLDAQGRPTRSSGIRKLEYFLSITSITDPQPIWLEMDVFWAHVDQYKFRTYTAHDGSTQTDIFDPAGLVTRHDKRYPLIHAKDGVVNTTNGMGYDMVPFGTGVIDYTTFFSRAGHRTHHNPMVEQDNAPSATDPAQSLQHAAIGYRNLAALRRWPRVRHGGLPGSVRGGPAHAYSFSGRSNPQVTGTSRR